jgi:hypothetical protein
MQLKDVKNNKLYGLTCAHVLPGAEIGKPVFHPLTIARTMHNLRTKIAKHDNKIKAAAAERKKLAEHKAKLTELNECDLQIGTLCWTYYQYQVKPLPSLPLKLPRPGDTGPVDWMRIHTKYDIALFELKPEREIENIIQGSISEESHQSNPVRKSFRRERRPERRLDLSMGL